MRGGPQAEPLPLTLILSIAPIGAVAVLLWLMEII